MSRHVIQGFDDNHYIVVGWDPPLSTFFCQVFDHSEDDEDEMPVLWLGAKIGEITDIMQLKAALQDFCTIPDLKISALVADQMAALR